MTQHTPGPWRVESRGGMAGREVRAGEALVVATVNTTSNDQGNREANARLIAAAPEMLEALQRLLSVTELNMDDMEDETRIAIQKAVDLVTPFEENSV